MNTYDSLHNEVVREGLCTHCGTCIGLSNETLVFRLTETGPLPSKRPKVEPELPPIAYDACPGKGLNYPDLAQYVFGEQPSEWLVGYYRQAYIGYSQNDEVRRAGASGGVITQTLLFLLETGQIDGAVVVRQGSPEPYEATPIIATSSEEIRACSQSVYVPVGVNVILEDMSKFKGRLAFVGLPDQVASIRRLQQLGHRGAAKVDYLLGPYAGLAMYRQAIESFLRSNGVHGLHEVIRLRYREGEWPGHLEITTRSGKVLRASKFYYNYLLPFYLTKSSLYSVDFTNELADISVGDAWHPRYEKQGEGFSVVLARSEKAERLLVDMESQSLLTLNGVGLTDVLDMHAHMLDFKKRGAFIRMKWRKRFGRRIPEYGYSPANMPFRRKLFEVAIYCIFLLSGTSVARRIMEYVPLFVLGPIFNLLRRTWKQMSKPTKRAGLYSYKVNNTTISERDWS